MRVVVLIKGDPDSEAGVLPDTKFVEEMLQFNEDLTKSGVLLDSQGLYPSAKGVKVKFTGRKATIIDGPFTEAKELIAGFWIWEVKSMEEAIEWVKRIPSPASATTGEIEIRPIYETPDFIAEVTEKNADQPSA